MFVHQRQNQIKVILLVKAAVTDMPTRVSGCPGNYTCHHQVRIATFDKSGGLQDAVFISPDAQPFLYSVEKYYLPEIKIGSLHHQLGIALVNDPSADDYLNALWLC